MLMSTRILQMKISLVFVDTYDELEQNMWCRTSWNFYPKFPRLQNYPLTPCPPHLHKHIPILATLPHPIATTLFLTSCYVRVQKLCGNVHILPNVYESILPLRSFLHISSFSVLPHINPSFITLLTDLPAETISHTSSWSSLVYISLGLNSHCTWHN